MLIVCQDLNFSTLSLAFLPIHLHAVILINLNVFLLKFNVESTFMLFTAQGFLRVDRTKETRNHKILAEF